MQQRKIKIAHLINYLSPAGKEVGIIKILNSLDSSLFEGALIVLDEVFDPLNLDTEKSKLISLNKKRGNDIKIAVELARIFREGKYDIIHTHAWGTLVEGILAAKLAGIPITIHGEHGTFHRSGKRRLVQKIFFNWADYVLSVSNVLADDLSRTLGVKRAKITAILNGVDINKFRPDAGKRVKYREKHKVDADTVWIGTVGRPAEVKNQHLMIRALPLLRKEGIPARFTIVGDTPMYSLRPELEKLAADLDVQHCLEFTGKQSDIAGYLNAFDIFVLPSLSEGCSNVILEAMACGVPVVASRVGGTPELIEHMRSGMLFESNDVRDLANALLQLINNRELATKLSSNALKRIKAEFTLDKMVANYQNFYLQAVSN